MASRADQLNNALDQLLANNPNDITGAVVVGADGMLLSARLGGDANVERVAAIAATMMGVTTRVAGELKIGNAEEAIVRAEVGYLLVMPVSKQAMLALTLRQNANLGLVRLESREAGRAVAASLNGI